MTGLGDAGEGVDGFECLGHQLFVLLLSCVVHPSHELDALGERLVAFFEAVEPEIESLEPTLVLLGEAVEPGGDSL